MTPFFAEFFGTFMLILLGNGVVANVLLPGTKGNNGGWMVITTGWALAVFVGVVVAAPYSGAHINPAVTIGLALSGNFTWAQVPLYITAQMLGAMTGSFMVWLFYNDHYRKAEGPNMKLATFATIPAIRNLKTNLFSETAGTFVLMFTIFFFSSASLESEVAVPIGLGSLGALPVAFLVWVIGLSLGGTTGYAINPARDLGPRIVHMLLPLKNKGSSQWDYAWVPVVGPLLGTVIAVGVFLLLSL
ncbi:aquaporin family protein [Robertkochia marina]|uniref:Aquaporin family protein n=1 Tax=Robertkochia marina TaxID=1227945 RepID=A0A4S3M236_9FLAO|nr:MIP/aquaporin family protein [Robertkochia marina]THD69172.1 aquaporin family protein [Robertkochia marina]TRZ47570.1 aquaporin family protein [Robertkochia marina]